MNLVSPIYFSRFNVKQDDKAKKKTTNKWKIMIWKYDSRSMPLLNAKFRQMIVLFADSTIEFWWIVESRTIYFLTFFIVRFCTKWIWKWLCGCIYATKCSGRCRIFLLFLHMCCFLFIHEVFSHSFFQRCSAIIVFSLIKL